MATIAYVLLCHKDPNGVAAQAQRLTAAGDVVAIHLDARAGAQDHAVLRRALAGNPSIVFSRRRVRCGWGEWSLVAATRAALDAALDAFPQATHFYLISGDCMPIKSAEHVRAALDSRDVDYIDTRDFFLSDWIKAGIREERLIYRHPFNERRHKALFYASIRLQQRLCLTRRIPADLAVRIGSQWWCLRRSTVEAIRAFCRRRKDVVRFFRGTWIPDETFFQTLVPHLVPKDQITARTPTFLIFSDYGIPVTFYDDHYDLLLGQDYFFARKISANALTLRDRLGQLYLEEGRAFPTSDEGRHLHGFLTRRGRIGRRFAPRMWDAGATIGRDRQVLVVACKKWHVAKRLVARINAVTGLQTVDYLFDEAATALPDLGGIETSLDKRGRHPRAVLSLLFDHWQTDRLVICVDPACQRCLVDVASDAASSRLLEVTCEMDDAYLLGHVRRVGLVSDRTPPDVLDRLLPAVREDMRHERERLRDAGFAQVHRMWERAPQDANAAALAGFLGLPMSEALIAAVGDHLFMD
jgi:hypothetical protein